MAPALGAPTRPFRFVFVEGLPGAGKTTTAVLLVREFRRCGRAARFLPEGPTVEEPAHPLRLAPTLPHGRTPWIDVTPEEYLTRSLARWRAFAREAETEEKITVCDGLLFHGNLTDLLVMDASDAVLDGYVDGVLGALRALEPRVVYLRPPDLDNALRRVSDERGPDWVNYQVGWRLAGPYPVRRALAGYKGWVELYRAHRALSDAAFARLRVPRLQVPVEGDWERHRQGIAAFVGLRSGSSMDA